MTTASFSARCHCGAIGYVLSTDEPPSDWPLRTCSCSFCTKHRPVYTSDPAGSVRFELGDGEAVVRYRFGHGTADFLLCARCGVYLGALMETDDGTCAVLNVSCMSPLPADLGTPTAVTLDGESSPDRVARRAARWTPVRDD